MVKIPQNNQSILKRVTGGSPKTKYDITEPKIFLSKALKTESEKCILWPFGTRSGYGQISWNGENWQAHRLIATLFYGDPPCEKHLACHKPSMCHTKLCINPHHLYWGNHQENSDDKFINGTNQRGVQIHTAKMTPDLVKMIIADNRKNTVIGAELGMNHSSIAKIKRRVHWSWVD